MTPVLAAVASAAAVGMGVSLWDPDPERRLSGSRRSVPMRWWRTVGTVGGRWPRVGLTVIGLAVVLVLGPMAIVPSVVVMGTALVWRRRRVAAQALRRRQTQDRDDVQALRALAAELRSGLPPPEALRAAAGHRPAAGLRKRMLAAAVADKFGGDPAASLGSGAEPGSAAGGIAAAWAVCQVTGAGLAAPVTRIADAAAAGLVLAREADAALASAHSSARLLAVLPVAGVALGVLSGTGSIRVLFATPPGQFCLLAGSALELAGVAWLDRLARAAA